MSFPAVNVAQSSVKKILVLSTRALWKRALLRSYIIYLFPVFFYILDLVNALLQYLHVDYEAQKSRWFTYFYTLLLDRAMLSRALGRNSLFIPPVNVSLHVLTASDARLHHCIQYNILHL